MKLIAEEKIRIDKYLMNELSYSRSKIQRMIDSNHILVNGNPVKNSYSLRIGDEITINEDYTEEIEIIPEDIPLDIYYEDDYLLVVNKPSGMVVHPAAGNHEKTLVNALMYHCNNNLSSINGSIRPGIVHRIDKDTSGLLLIAKTDEVHADLAEQIANKTVTRKYIALVQGTINEDTATIDAPIGRDSNNRKKMAVTDINSKDAITHLRVLARYSKATLIECQLETGRTHQIRVHLNYIGHPIVNDPVYGYKKLEDPEFGQMLHAKTIGFIHPITKKYLEFNSNPPKRFEEILDQFKA
ncbi:MAG: RluA family pseudouridine synthase [Bacilli bacterium]|nr:RluA family pseudouridine synthase [Bacilli bacterium]